MNQIRTLNYILKTSHKAKPRNDGFTDAAYEIRRKRILRGQYYPETTARQRRQENSRSISLVNIDTKTLLKRLAN